MYDSSWYSMSIDICCCWIRCLSPSRILNMHTLHCTALLRLLTQITFMILKFLLEKPLLILSTWLKHHSYMVYKLDNIKSPTKFFRDKYTQKFLAWFEDFLEEWNHVRFSLTFIICLFSGVFRNAEHFAENSI